MESTEVCRGSEDRRTGHSLEFGFFLPPKSLMVLGFSGAIVSVPSPTLHEVYIVVHTCNPRIHEAEVREIRHLLLALAT